MNKIYFTNLNKSSMTLSAPQWQEDITAKIEAEYQQQAIDTSDAIKAAFLPGADKLPEGYFATAFMQVLKNTPRYAYIKNISDPWGGVYDAEIDLALHTVRFIEIK